MTFIVYTYQNFPVHGFQSSMQVPLNIGLPENHIDSIHLLWPDGKEQTINKNITLDETITISTILGGILIALAVFLANYKKSVS